MGDNTTIGLLTNINNSLGKIVEAMLPQNQDAKKGQEQSVKNLSQGSLSSGANAASAAAPAARDISGLNVAQIVSSLDGLPEQVKTIAKLSGKTIKNFELVLNSIIDIFSQDSFKSLGKSQEVGASIIKTLTELNALPETVNNISDIREKDVKRLSDSIVEIARIFSSEEMKSITKENKTAVDLIKTLNELGALPDIVKTIGKIKEKDIKRFTNSILEIAKIFSSDEMKNVTKENKVAIDLMKTLTELGKLPEVLKDVSKIKEKHVKNFTKTVSMLLDMITKSLRKSGVSDNDIKLAKKTTDTILALTSAVKSLAKMTLIAPLAMVGLLAMIPVWITFSAVLVLIGLLEKPIQKGLRALRGVDRFMTKMLKTALLGIVVAGGVILLGLVLKENMDLMMYGLAGIMTVFLAVGVIAILGGLVGLLIKSTNIFDKQIIKFTLELMLIAGLTIVLGMLLQVAWKQALFGLGGMLVVMLAMIGIALLIRLVGEISMSSIKAMAGVLLLMLASMAIAALTASLGQYIEKNWDYALVGFAAMNAILLEVLGIAVLAKRVAKDAKSGVTNLLIAEGVILGAMAIVWATIKTGELVWNYFGTDTGTAIAKVAIIGAVTTAIILGAWGVTKIANRASKDIKKGAIALLLAEGVILASAVVALAVIGVTKVMETVEPDALTNTLLTMATIVGAAGVVAVIASKFQSSIMKGALVMVVLEALVLGMVGVMYALVMTAKAATEIGWANVFITVCSMIVLLGLFVGLTAAFALLCNPYTLAALAAGGAVMLSISLLILAVTGTTMAVIKLSEMMDKSGKTTEELGELLRSITHDVFSYKNLNPEISVVQAAKLSAKYLLLMPALLGIMAVVGVVSDMAKKFGGLSEMRGDDYYVSPYYGMNGNEPVFGEPVNIPKIAENIVQAITIFSNNLFEGFERVDLKRLLAVGVTMQSLIEPVSQFAQMVSGFKDGEGPNSLKPVFVTPDGNIRYGESVNVVHVATSIASAISAFATELYGNGDDVPKWMKFMGKRRNKKRLERAMNTFALIIEPVDQFINMLLGYQSAGPGMIKKSAFDEQGNYIENGAPAVNVAQVAAGIASSISTFARILFGDGDSLPGWMNIFRREKNATAASKAMNVLSEIITPVSSFLDALMAIEAKGGSMYYVWVDEKGNIQRKPVDLRKSANAIAGAIGIFVEELFGPKTTQAWENMLNLSSQYSGRGTLFNPAESPFAAFGIIVEPISNFIKMIADIGGDSSAGDGTISFPIFDKDGNQISTRVVNLVAVSTAISGAVTKFLETMFSDKNMEIWDSLLYKKDKWGDRDGYSNLDKSIGVFATLIDPVVKFAEVVTKFGGTADNFKIYDGEKERTVNLIDVATSIANAVTSFMTTLRPAFNDLEFGIDEKNKICDFATAVGDILENFAKIGELKVEQIDVANSIIDSYNIAIQKISETVNTLPEMQLVINMGDIMQKCIDLFSIFKDIKFEELNYKEGLEHVTFVFTQCAAISEISAKINKDAFDVIDRFVKAATVLKDFLGFSSFFSPDRAKLDYYIVAITDISTTYANIPLIPDTDENRKKLWFIEPFLAAAVLIKGVITADSSFASNTKAMLDFIMGMGNSMLALGTTPATDLNEVSKAYAALLERVIKLSDRRNVKSISAMNDAIKEATTRMTKFDDRLIKNANDRKKKLDELIETVGNLNDKLEKTAKSMEDIAKDLEKISKFDEDTIKRNVDAANGGASRSSSSPAERGGVTSPVGIVGGRAAGGSTTRVEDIQKAITDALRGLKFVGKGFEITLSKDLLDSLGRGSGGVGGSGSTSDAVIRVGGHDTEIDNK